MFFTSYIGDGPMTAFNEKIGVLLAIIFRINAIGHQEGAKKGLLFGAMVLHRRWQTSLCTDVWEVHTCPWNIFYFILI